MAVSQPAVMKVNRRKRCCRTLCRAGYVKQFSVLLFQLNSISFLHVGLLILSTDAFPGVDARLRGTNQVFAGDIDESMVCTDFASWLTLKLLTYNE